MFWKFLIAATLAAVLIKLGALSVWVSVLKAMLSIVFVVIIAGGLLYLWRRYKGE